MKSTVIVLSDQQPIAKGKTRRIYQHPAEPDCLIKVHRSRLDSGEHTSGLKGWFHRAEDRFLYMSGILRELEQYVASRYRGMQPIAQHIVPIHGVVDTDIGMGLMVSAARDAQGGLAPTVRRVLKSGEMTPKRAQQLEQVLDDILACDIVLGDLNQDNLVLVDAGLAHERFMLIDGLGERTLLPVQRWSRWLRQRHKRQFISKMRARLSRRGLPC